jgi:hypothetical protein
MIKILLCLMLCLAFVSCDKCRNYQDIAGVEIVNIDGGTDIDSVAMVANNSITGCGNPRYGSMIGSKTHSIKFPVNMHIKLFAEDSLWKELSFEMSRNTVLKIYGRYDCLINTSTISPVSFYGSMALAKKSNRYIDSFIDDDYCWLLERMDSSYDDRQCVEWGAGGPVDLCKL